MYILIHLANRSHIVPIGIHAQHRQLGVQMSNNSSKVIVYEHIYPSILCLSVYTWVCTHMTACMPHLSSFCVYMHVHMHDYIHAISILCLCICACVYTRDYTHATVYMWTSENGSQELVLLLPLCRFLTVYTCVCVHA